MGPGMVLTPEQRQQLRGGPRPKFPRSENLGARAMVR